jgi:uncharacterized membrane protein YfcA
LAFLVLFLNPHGWLNDGVLLGADDRSSNRLEFAMVCVGLWAGLIVIDAGIYLLIYLVTIGGLSIRQVNAGKVVLISVATLISLFVFIADGGFDWASGLPLMLGSALGVRLGGALVLAIALQVVFMFLMWVHPKAYPVMM